MKIYNYDKQTGELLSESIAKENPLEQGKYLIPANATTKEPIASIQGFVTIFKDNEWTSIEDIRGTWYNIREEVEVTSLDYDMTGLTKEPVPFTEEELQAQARAEFKAERDKSVSELEITYNDVVYQADEVSQGRMSRAILALPDDTTTTLWIASDNTPMQVTKVDLANMLRMAGEAQTALWTA